MSATQLMKLPLAFGHTVLILGSELYHQAVT